MGVYYYGRLVADRVAWTDSNDGRRFKTYIKGSSGWNYFQWVNDPLCSRAQIVIPNFVEEIEKYGSLLWDAIVRNRDEGNSKMED